MKIPTAVLHETPATLVASSVLLVDAPCKRFAVDACCDMVHALAAAFALEAHAGGSPDWGSVAVVVHDSMTDALKAVHDSLVLAPLSPALARKKSLLRKLLQSHQHLRPVALLVVLLRRLARGRLPLLLLTLVLLLLLEGAVALRSPHQSLRQSTSIWMTWTSRLTRKRLLQKFKSAKSAGPVKWKLSFHLSVIVKTSGRAKVVGTFTLTDRHGNPSAVLLRAMLSLTLFRHSLRSLPLLH